MTADSPYLTVDEFAALLRLPRSSVYEAVASGRLEHRRVGRSIRIHRDAGFVAAEPRAPRRRTPRLVVVRNQRGAIPPARATATSGRRGGGVG